MQMLYQALAFTPEVIHHFLNHHVFPKVLQKQATKLQVWQSSRLFC